MIVSRTYIKIEVNININLLQKPLFPNCNIHTNFGKRLFGNRTKCSQKKHINPLKYRRAPKKHLHLQTGSCYIFPLDPLITAPLIILISICIRYWIWSPGAVGSMLHIGITSHLILYYTWAYSRRTWRDESDKYPPLVRRGWRAHFSRYHV